MRGVRTVRVAWLTRVILVTLCLLVHGCTNVTGGAVELSWKLRPRSGPITGFLDCDGARIAFIELAWDVNGVTDSRTWNCGDGHGVTGFDIPVGSVLLSVRPICPAVPPQGPQPAQVGTYIVPAPERRDVIVGNTISLGAVELVLQVSDCSDMQPCVCQ